jgi:hypothetical protein
MIWKRTAVIGAFLVVAIVDVSSAQGRVADSVLKATKQWMDSLTMADRLGWNSPCLPRGDFPYGGAYLSTACLSEVPLPTPPPETVPSVALVDSIAVVVGNWHGVIAAHLATGQRDIAFALRGLDAGGARAPSLLLRCQQGRLAVDIATPQLRGHPHSVRVRLGTDPPEDQEWLAGPGDTALFFSGDQQQVEAFIHTLSNYRRLTIEVRPDESSSRDYMLDARGITTVEAQLRAACT